MDAALSAAILNFTTSIYQVDLLIDLILTKRSD